MAIHSPLGSVDGVPVGIVHLAAEYDSLARTGGLAEAVSGLASYQAARGSPSPSSFRSIARSGALHRSWNGSGSHSSSRWATARRKAGSTVAVEAGKPKVYCIEHEYFDRAGLYGEAGSGYRG